MANSRPACLGPAARFTVAIVSGSKILVQPKGLAPRLYDYQLGAGARVDLLTDNPAQAELQQRLEAFLQVATQSLLDNSAGVRDSKPE
ncbi:hypothetical protein LRS11_14315 [Pseudomonas sp. J452]|uniref:hypothetical protein n=1 Tax=Pseudomonas sp. J452 TaxID=2898441 RepID=UPI0021ADB2F8|nr:hypothetical protein [Pseudomonas sp. J452]UUY07007.1 hypothetical protein LRS11_14315 [Pseudomonas sp. J452]